MSIFSIHFGLDIKFEYKHKSTCSLEEFAVYFLNFLHNQTEDFTKGNSSTCNTPRKITTTGFFINNNTQIQEINIINTTENEKLKQNNIKLLNNSNNDELLDEKQQLKSCLNNKLKNNSKIISRDLFPALDKCKLNKSSSSSSSLLSPKNTPITLLSSPTTTTTTTIPKAIITETGFVDDVNELVKVKSDKFIDLFNNTSTIKTPPQTDIYNDLFINNFNSYVRNNSTPTNNNKGKTPDQIKRKPSSFNNSNSNSKQKNILSTTSSSSSATSSPATSFCLADFIVPPTNTKIKRRSRTNQNDSQTPPPPPQQQQEQSKSNHPNNLQHQKKIILLSPTDVNSNINSSGNGNGNTSTPIVKNITITPESSSKKVIKPKRRVVPLKINSIKHNNNNQEQHSFQNEFITSSFQSDNNLLHVMSEETEQTKKCLLNDRDLLKREKEIITKDFFDEINPNKILCLHKVLEGKIPSSLTSSPQPSPKRSKKINLKLITNKNFLDILINLHSLIIDLNLTTNVLTEISFLLNLINADINETTTADVEKINHLNDDNITDNQNDIIDPNLINPIEQIKPDYSDILKSFNNYLYFSVGVLNKQRNLLALLDLTTIKVLIDNERLSTLDISLKEFLQIIHGYKIKLETNKINFNSFSMEENKLSKNVFYQQENDTKENFLTEREFHDFKKQRDLFYSILRNWEFKHLNPTFDFNLDFQRRVTALFQILNTPITMTHLAKLFVAQLIISCNFDDTTPEIQLALPNVDLNKLSKLQQRLVAPSNFSIEYLFPGNQAFFRDFIIASEISIHFIEQLKVVLVHELVEINNSSAESTNIDDVDLVFNDNEYLIRPENLTTLRVLAKFIGFIVSRPFSYGNIFNSVIDKTQISLRNTSSPPFDINSILLTSIDENKLLVTIPWIVQYLSMLDHVTLQLEYYKKILNILYELYIIIDINFNMRPTVNFIIRTCLGWLFEHPAIPIEYYVYRQNRTTNVNISDLSQNDLKLKIFDKEIIKQKQKLNDQNMNINLKIIKNSLDPVLESLLNVACPFLADFRVSIMPTQVLKTVSRTGRYRHITTTLTEKNISLRGGGGEKNTDLQKILLDEFLQSQSQSVRKTIDFIIERVTSAVIKDFQMESLLPIKKNVRCSLDNDSFKVYNNALVELTKEWKIKTPLMIDKRVKEAFSALLPNETMEDLKKTYIRLAIRKCIDKTNEWRISYCSNIEIFKQDMKLVADKILIAPVTDINIDKIKPSTVFYKLQIILHDATMNATRLKYIEIKQFLIDFHECLNNQILPQTTYKLSVFMTLQMILLIICNRPNFLTDDLMKHLQNLWKCNKLKDYVTPKEETADSDDDDDNDKDEKINSLDNSLENNSKDEIDLNSSSATIKTHQNIIVNQYIFYDLLSHRCLELIRNKPQICFEMFGKFICFLIKNNFFTLTLLNEQCVRLFKRELPQDILCKLSFLMDFIACNIKDKNKKTHLFMEMLSDLARDLEDF